MQRIAVFGTITAGFLAGITGAPWAQADPDFGPAEQNYLSDLRQYVHPGVTDARLVELGNLTCSARHNGSSTDAATSVVAHNLDASGVLSSNAEIGSLVHVAIDNLCPEVGYP
jgi:hypothetical protein